MTDPVPCQIRGVTYTSLKAAADALGCTRGAVWSAIEHGTTDTLMTGKRPRMWRPCRINGQFFKSRTAAARAFGVSPQDITQAVRGGRFTVTPNRAKETA